MPKTPVGTLQIQAFALLCGPPRVSACSAVRFPNFGIRVESIKPKLYGMNS